jgi:uncharacterized protein YkwD
LRWQTPSDRAKKAGYKWFITGENISPSNAPWSAIGKEERNLWWMWSKWHRENILNPDAKSVGLWYVNIKRPPKTQWREETEYNYFVMIFGSN